MERRGAGGSSSGSPVNVGKWEKEEEEERRRRKGMARKPGKDV